MKQPDTAALRERLANYTSEDELEQDKRELDGLLQEVNCQLIELRNLLKRNQCAKGRTARHTRQLEAYRPTGTDGFQCLACGKGQCGQYRGRHQPCHCQGGTAHRHPCQNWHR